MGIVFNVVHKAQDRPLQTFPRGAWKEIEEHFIPQRTVRNIDWAERGDEYEVAFMPHSFDEDSKTVSLTITVIRLSDG